MKTSIDFWPQHATDVELLAQLIGDHSSQRLYGGSLQPFFGLEGDGAPVQCLAAKELIKRWLAEELMGRQAFTSTETVKDYLKLHFAGREYESFVVLYVDAQHCLIGMEELFRGTLTQTSVYPREVVKSALRRNAAGVIFAHNHPSGSTGASRADEQLTQTLKTSLALVDVRVLDHFIVATQRTASFAEMGLL